MTQDIKAVGEMIQVKTSLGLEIQSNLCIFQYDHQYKTNVIRLYDYFIIGGLLSCSCLMKDMSKTKHMTGFICDGQGHCQS